MHISPRRRRAGTAAAAPETGTAAATLAEVPVGADAVLAELRVPDRLGRRLAELGLRPGRSVVVAQRISGGGRVISADGVRYAIDRRTLAGIGVRR